MSETETWERLDSDTDKSYEAFCIYRDMGSNRTLRKLARALNKSLTLVGEWSIKHQWQERVSAYDDYLRTEHRKRLETAKLKVAENVLNDYEALRKSVTKRLEIIEKVNHIVDIGELQELLSLMHRLDDYARRAVGLPNEIIENNSNVNLNRQVPPLSDDTLEDVLNQYASGITD